jgi:hypothetical protein
MHCSGHGRAAPQPEKEAAVGTEALEVAMPRRAILAVVVEALHDSKWRQGLGVKIDRAIKVAHC